MALSSFTSSANQIIFHLFVPDALAAKDLVSQKMQRAEVRIQQKSQAVKNIFLMTGFWILDFLHLAEHI